ncbi:hypothetical protein A3G67_03150 [Candidatus Roizmanbacteria bacterium RIFCSPLOWO2_12_FULL_40_12]|uniref:Glycosyl transferase family 1 domain-containing protein n=1 Tax=Candidatus Roizmanbacteria bacterium RIFCSPLOWO2_01_FULL_40_42 TaxID=1802066 RepID=A0A1F7J5D7_9BACT|nr:MAG: hypothetical protein A2779_02785 [Candidatus Roizmanbacteria bacterium RIFCSPHIGHO2_01_FULL_40_98]OGK28269.1 MAG: hypothetical protein A3C31_00150 [Candidatus Roizmanbacteria bacterium RIFCSPHIGHO2_02_FULL_40_53]OGK30505.1 MAG: hypothetical protein A2W49_02835 [Candidatus Roizmanbacteria bacterium RIFCSPHIGHO2_12_41_18]OGK36919.1 MAG: hypothetical protein A3E69_00410 [Candidatus Roizmanbacteria bacterium RIFCSPHIGHO2_12_FULL_40_130]OGK50825.1 MAG: hypothetical protein A3B50_00920 [Candi
MTHIKRVLLITPFAPPQLGGAETHLEDLYEYLRHENYNVTLLTYKPLVGRVDTKSIEKKKNLTIYRYQWFGENLFAKFESYPPIFNFLYITPYLLVRSFIHMLLNKNKYDLIHVFGLNASFIGRFLKLVFNQKIVMSSEALYDFVPGSFFAKVARWVLKDLDAILVGSEESRDEFVKLGLPKKKIIVYIHWIRLKNFKPANKDLLKRKLGWKNKFTVLYVGRLIRIKGIRVFIDVAKQVGPSIQFKIIGDGGPELDYVKSTVAKLSNTEYLGKIPNTKIGKYFAASDVYIYPALYNEDLARVLLESMAAGTPVINSNQGSGVYRLTKDVGYVLKPNPKEIRQKIIYLSKNPEIAKQMSSSSIKFARQFGPKLGRIITQTYEKILKKNN